MTDYHELTFILERIASVLVCLLLPFISINYAQPIDLVWLQSNSLNLIATSGTMATISLVFLFERITALLPVLWMRFLASISILYFLFASLAGLLYHISTSSFILIQGLFWFTLFGIICLMIVALIIFVSEKREVI